MIGIKLSYTQINNYDICHIVKYYRYFDYIIFLEGLQAKLLTP